MEKIDEILREMRNLAQSYKDSNDEIPRRHMAVILTRHAYTIEAAVKVLIKDRDNWRKQALAEDARANQQKDWRKICAACQEGEPPEDCEFYGEPDGCNARPRCAHPTCKDSLQVGNSAALRKALKQARKVFECAIIGGALKSECIHETLNVIAAALAAPARNCELYETEGEAYQAYLTAMKNETAKTYVYFEPWLFEKAKGN